MLLALLLAMLSGLALPVWAQQQVLLNDSFDTPASKAHWELTGDWRARANSPCLPNENGYKSADTALAFDYGTSCAYRNNKTGYATLLQSVSIPISAPSATLQWWDYVGAELGADFYFIQVSTDNGLTWSYEVFRESLDETFWDEEIVDLSAFVGKSIRVRFGFTSDDTITNFGWYVDDVRIIAGGLSQGVSAVAISDASLQEGTNTGGGASRMSFTISVDPANDEPITLEHETRSGTASAGYDFVARSGPITIPANTSSAKILVDINDDVFFERDETFQLVLSAPSDNAVVTVASATGTIVDDEELVCLYEEDFEPRAGSLRWSVPGIDDPFNQAAPGSELWHVQSASVCLLPGNGYSSLSTALVFNDEARCTYDTDGGIEGTVEMTEAVVITNPATGKTSDDVLGAQLSFRYYLETMYTGESASRTEAFVEISIDGGQTWQIVQTYSPQDASDQPIVQPWTDEVIDLTPQIGEDVRVRFRFNQPAEAVRHSAAGWFVDDVKICIAPRPDEISKITVTPASSSEGNSGTTSLDFDVTVYPTPGSAGAPASLQKIIAFETVPLGITDAAEEDVDYVGTSGQIVIQGTAGTGKVRVLMIGEDQPEPDEFFDLQLRTISDNVFLVNDTVRGTILDDDAPSQFLLSVQNSNPPSQTVSEADGTVTFSVQLSQARSVPIDVDYTTVDGTALSGLGLDYESKSGSLHFPANTLKNKITITMLNDKNYEDPDELTMAQEPETFSVKFTTASTFAQGGTVVVPVLDDDPAPPPGDEPPALNLYHDPGTEADELLTLPEGSCPTISAEEPCESVNKAKFVVTLSAANPTFDTTVDYKTINGSATSGEDYTETTGTLTIEKGELKAIIEVPILADRKIEEAETFEVSLSNPIVVGDATAQVNIVTNKTACTIVNDDYEGTAFGANGTDYTSRALPAPASEAVAVPLDGGPLAFAAAEFKGHEFEKLYGWDSDNKLKSVNVATGKVTAISASAQGGGADMTGLAWDNTNGIMYACSADGYLYEVNLSNGTLSGALNGVAAGLELAAVAVHPTSGRIYMFGIDTASVKLYELIRGEWELADLGNLVDITPGLATNNRLWDADFDDSDSKLYINLFDGGGGAASLASTAATESAAAAADAKTAADDVSAKAPNGAFYNDAASAYFRTFDTSAATNQAAARAIKAAEAGESADVDGTAVRTAADLAYDAAYDAVQAAYEFERVFFGGSTDAQKVASALAMAQLAQDAAAAAQAAADEAANVHATLLSQQVWLTRSLNIEDLTSDVLLANPPVTSIAIATPPPPAGVRWTQDMYYASRQPDAVNLQADAANLNSADAGARVSGVGDVNGDNFEDFVVTARDAAANGLSGAGKAFLFYGSPESGYPERLIAKLREDAAFGSGYLNSDKNNGVVISGSAANEHLGASVTGVGDMNGDDIADFALGYEGSNAAGGVYLIFGRLDMPQAFKTTEIVELPVAGTNEVAGVRIYSKTAGDLAGAVISGAGDFNSDGLGALLIGAPHTARNGGHPGAAYLIFGSSTGIGANGAIDLSALKPPRGLRFYGEADGDEFGHAVSGSGDINGDGLTDLAIGAPSADNEPGTSLTTDEGAVYVILGHVDYAETDAPNPIDLGRLQVQLPTSATTSIPSLILTVVIPEDGDLADSVTPNLGTISPISGELPGMRIMGEAADSRMGETVAGVGDMNGDGLDDIAFAAPDYDGSSDAEANWGRAYVLLGSEAHTAVISASDIGGSAFGLLLRGIDENDDLRVGAVGDTNGDGRMDLAVGAPFASPGGFSGEVYLLLGRASMDGEMSLRDLASSMSNGYFLYNTHEGPGLSFGRAASTAGDFNNDSITDWVVGREDGAFLFLGKAATDSGRYVNRMVTGVDPLAGLGGGDLGRVVQKGVGETGDFRYSTPASRVEITFKGGGGPGQLSEPSTQTVTLYRKAAPDVAVGEDTPEDDARWIPAGVHWKVHTTRREFTESTLEFYYRPEEVAGLDLDKVKVFYAKSTGNVGLSENTAWSWLPVTPDADRNVLIVHRSHTPAKAQTEFNGYYALVQADLLTYLGGVIPAVGVTNENVYAFGPTVTPAGLTFWHSGDKKLYAIAEGNPTIIWLNTLNEVVSEVQVENRWPADESGVYQDYVAGSPGVVLDDPDSGLEFPYAQLTAQDAFLISNSEFTAEDLDAAVESSKTFVAALQTAAPTGTAARSLIMLSTKEAPDQGELYFQFNKTRRWNDPSRLLGGAGGVPWDVGTIISATTDTNYGTYHDDVSGSPYVLFENAPYAVESTRYQGFYDRGARAGSIVPVNTVGAGMDDLVLVFYEQGAKLIEAKTGGFVRDADTRQYVKVFDWPYISAKYNPAWPTGGPEIVIARQDGSGEIDVATYGAELDIYYEEDSTLPGYNPNEEHALIRPYGGGQGVFALRNDLNGYENASEPYALMTYYDPNDLNLAGDPIAKMKAFHVTDTQGIYVFGPWSGVSKIENPYWGDVAAFIQPPYPLSTFQYSPRNTSPDISGPTNPTGKVFEDRNFRHWAMSEAPAGDYITMKFYYPPQEGFYIPAAYLSALEAADDRTYDFTVGGDHIPWLDGGTGDPVNVSMRADWPEVTPEMNIGEILLEAKFGLPQINGQCSVDLIYQESVDDGDGPSVELVDPIRTKSVELQPEPGEDLAMLPSDIAVGIRGSELSFTDLPPELQFRISYDPNNALLKLSGIVVDPVLGFDYILLNVINQDDADLLKALSPGSADGSAWYDAVDALYAKSHEITRIIQGQTGSDPFKIDAGLAEALALSSGNAQGTGYVTLAFQNAEACAPLPVSVEVIRVVPTINPGSIAVVKPGCVFEEKLTLMQTNDFGGHPENFTFEWLYRPDEGGTLPLDPDDDPFNWAPPPINEPSSGPGISKITISGPGLLTLTDNWFVVRYKALDTGPPWNNVWSDWTPVQLGEGWIKRVVGAINPFTQRASGGGIAGAEAQFASFGSAEAPFTLVSMISQAGPRYTGSLPLNCEALDEFGLIPIYQTVQDRGMDLSVNALSPVDNPGVNTALLLVASRVADLYTLLGNEAYADAADPTIGFGTDDGVYGAQATSIHAFMNQTSSLLEEELGLLRGRDDTYAPSLELYPLYNRLIWNFTRDITGGEVAYALNYNIKDLVDGGDGVLSEADAKRLYPQGHGDAWGHYLTAISAYYKLLAHPFYTWANRSEALLVGGQPVTVDYIDERKFARIAAAKARTGSEIVNLAYRQSFVEDPEGQWQGYKDADPERGDYADWVAAGKPTTYYQWVYRGWGFSEWASRAGQASYIDWLVGNAILRAEDPNPAHTGITKIDRTTVSELKEVPAAYDSIQAQEDGANLGLNPLGLGTNVIPFDIDPTLIDDGQTHFEQIFTRAATSLSNTETVFNMANNSTQLLRRQADSQENFERAVLDTEKDYESRLIEIFGYPYPEDIGPGGTYPSGYEGADLYHYMYSDESGFFRDQEIRSVYFEPQSDGDNGEDIPAIGTVKGLTDTELETYVKDHGEVDIGTGDITFKVEVQDYFGITHGPVLTYADILTLLGIPTTLAGGQGSTVVIGAGSDNIDLTNILPSAPITVKYNFSNKGGRFGITKPASWTSERRAPGEIQLARSELIQALAQFMTAIDDYGGYVGDVNDLVEKIERQYGLTADKIRLKTDRLSDKKTAQDIIFGLRIGQFALRTAATIVDKVSDALQESVPTVTGVIIGFSNGIIIDGLAPVRGGLKGVGVAIVETLKAVADGLDLAVLRLEQSGERADDQLDIDITQLEGNFDNLQAVFELQSKLRGEMPLRIALHQQYDSVMAASGRYLKVLADGQRVMDRLETFRRQTAADVQQQRYKDMAFRIFRNDAIQKYRAQFDLSARYVYLAAKAYDYETTFLSEDPLSGQRFLTDIVRARQIGTLDDSGVPLTGVGLANPMAIMARNFEVLDGQLGFNNPQTETNRFSLRRELLRILPDADGDEVWRETLNQDFSVHGIGIADNLWDVPEFNRFCVPPAGFGSVEPGLIIPFSSTIEEGRNFFGREAGGLDSSYDSTQFATKVRSVGVWFTNYDYLGLSNTPRVYLVPSGVDVMRSPTGFSGTERRFTVLDQRLPVPFPISSAEAQDPSWIPAIDSLSGPFEAIRRYGRLRAYHDSGEYSIDEMHRDSRLIGRSVWNTKWLLIIPASTLSNNRDEGLQRFINGQLAEGERDGNGVKDIKIFFETYAYPRLKK